MTKSIGYRAFSTLLLLNAATPRPKPKINDNGAATNIGPANILSVFAQASNSDAEVKLYNEVGGTTAANLIFHGKFGTAANHVHEFKIPAAGIYASDAVYADLTNVDFFYIIGTF